MSPLATLWISLGPAVLAILITIVTDMAGSPTRGRAAAAWLLAVGGVAGIVAGWNAEVALVHGTLRAGGVFSTVQGLVMLAAAIAIISAAPKVNAGSTAALVALGAVGASVAFAGADLTTLLIGLEITALCGYALVSSTGSARASEASMKYFVQGAIATGFFVLGMAVMVGVFEPDGSLSSLASAIGSAIGTARAASLGFIALIAAVAFKAGAAPFHSWAPDAYETAEGPSSAFLAGAVKLAMISVLASLVTALAPAGASAQRPFGILGLDMIVVLGGLAIASIIVGSTIALKTRSYKRMLGYAGIAQVGYALIALAALNPSGAIVFASTYAISTTAAFLAADAFGRLTPDWDGTIEGLTGLGRRFPALGAALTVALMSLAGIPPLVGFWGKLQAFGAGVSATVGFNAQGEMGLSAWLGVLVSFGVIGSVISLGYYGSVVRALFSPSSEPVEPRETAEEPDRPTSVKAVIILAGLIVLLGLLPIVIGIPESVSGFLLTG